jgi:phenylpropionate dioxygenase-like ring-hydroxylating dioxygenase large terminal subunit
MSRLDFWHPVLASRDLPRDRPVGVKLAGIPLVLFRAEDRQFGALEDKCAHRRMNLSTGRVDDGRVICPYHGWSFASTGEGESPSAPKMHACATGYDCAETSGVVWVKTHGSQQALPTLVKDG